MKKISLIAIASAIMFNAARAEYVAVQETMTMPNGMTESILSVEQVKTMRDEAPVIMVGRIVQNMGDEKYLFEDATGDIIVEIDDDEWNGVKITPADTVKVWGEVDSGMSGTKIDIETIEVM